jgi:hypothetical protein
MRELGRGGMATVCLAQDLELRCEAAVKVPDPEPGVAGGAPADTRFRSPRHPHRRAQ